MTFETANELISIFNNFNDDFHLEYVYTSPDITINDINNIINELINRNEKLEIIDEYTFCVQREENYNYICEFMIGLDGDKFIMIEKIELVD